jgi:hypothetical protein
MGLTSSVYYKRVKEGQRPSFPEPGPEQKIQKQTPLLVAFKTVIGRCWAFSPAARPTALEVVALLEKLVVMKEATDPSASSQQPPPGLERPKKKKKEKEKNKKKSPCVIS